MLSIPYTHRLAVQRQQEEEERRKRAAAQQQQQGGQQPDLQQAQDAYDMYKKFSASPVSMVGGSSTPTAGSMSGIGTAANSSVVGSQAGGLSAGPNAAWMSQIAGGGGAAPAASSAAPAAGGQTGMMSLLSNPWTALAAAVVGNEVYQKEHGNRNDDWGKYGRDLVTGKVMVQDVDKYLAHNPIGDAARKMSKLGTPQGMWEATGDGFKKIGGFFSDLF